MNVAAQLYTVREFTQTPQGDCGNAAQGVPNRLSDGALFQDGAD